MDPHMDKATGDTEVPEQSAEVIGKVGIDPKMSADAAAHEADGADEVGTRTADDSADQRTGNDGLRAADVESRSRLAASITPKVFPADREALLADARRQKAPDEVLEQLARLPDGTFEHLEAVWEALGGDVEFRA
jgi:hypothetical protein